MHELLALDDPPTAIFTARNILSTGAVRALAERGLRRDVALVGFDDFPLADLLDPPLTVIRQDVARIGKTVADLLFDRIDGQHRTTSARRVRADPGGARLRRDPAARLTATATTPSTGRRAPAPRGW